MEEENIPDIEIEVTPDDLVAFFNAPSDCDQSFRSVITFRDNYFVTIDTDYHRRVPATLGGQNGIPHLWFCRVRFNPAGRTPEWEVVTVHVSAVVQLPDKSLNKYDALSNVFSGERVSPFG